MAWPLRPLSLSPRSVVGWRLLANQHRPFLGDARGTDEINSAPLVAGDVLSCFYQIDGNWEVALKLPRTPGAFGFLVVAFCLDQLGAR